MSLCTAFGVTPDGNDAVFTHVQYKDVKFLSVDERFLGKRMKTPV